MSMTGVQYLLIKLAEEAAEVSQIALKAAQFGLDEVYQEGDGRNNAQRVHGELDDLLAVLQMLNEEHNFGYRPNLGARARKKQKVLKYKLYAVSLGQVRAD
jgi:hypothetical protein